jgi:hypothetical protein
MLSRVGRTAPKHARCGSIAVILDTTRTRRLDLNEQTSQRASNSGSRVNCTKNNLAPQRRAKSADNSAFAGRPIIIKRAVHRSIQPWPISHALNRTGTGTCGGMAS